MGHAVTQNGLRNDNFIRLKVSEHKFSNTLISYATVFKDNCNCIVVHNSVFTQEIFVYQSEETLPINYL